MIWSGLLIYWANDVYGIRIGGHEYVKLLPDKMYAPSAPSWWPKAIATYSGYRGYQERTQREIPLVILEPRSA